MTQRSLITCTHMAALILLGSTNAAIAASGSVGATHRVVQASDLPSYSQVTYSVNIENQSVNGLSNVTLEAVGLPLLSNNDSGSLLHIGRIPAGGIIAVDWTVNSKFQASYFQSGSPLTFRATAITDSGERIDFPLYSKNH